MNTTDLQLINEAIAQAQAGQKVQAYATLHRYLPTYPNEPNLLLWLTFTAPSVAESRRYLDQLAWLDPANPALPSARQWLAQQEAAATQAVTPVAVAPKPKPASPPDDLRRQLGAKPSAPAVAAPYLSRRRTGLYVAIGLVLVIALIVGIGVVIANQPASSNAAPTAVVYGTPNPKDNDRMVAHGLPVYPNSIRVNLTNADRQQLVNQGLNDIRVNLGANRVVAYYDVEMYVATKDTDTEQDIYLFFDTQMSRASWNFGNRNLDHNYTSGTKSLKVKVTPVGQLDEAFSRYNLPRTANVITMSTTDVHS